MSFSTETTEYERQAEKLFDEAAAAVAAGGEPRFEILKAAEIIAKPMTAADKAAYKAERVRHKAIDAAEDARVAAIDESLLLLADYQDRQPDDSWPQEEKPDPFETPYPFQVIEAADFAGGEYVEPEWQVYELVPKRGTGLDVGASQTLKSFKGLELATCINRGTPYHGRAAQKGRAVIVVAEGTFGYPVRMKALAKHLECDISELPAVIPAAPNLFQREQVDVLIRELKKRGATYVVIDTKWRCSVGAEENSAKDSAVVFGAMERISRELSCFVTAISHTGLQDGTRIRGSSSQFAAVDVEILHERNGDIVTSTVTKLKEAEGGAVIAMKLRHVELGRSRETGNPYGSLVLDPADVAATAKSAARLPTPGKAPRAAYDAIAAFIRESGGKVDLESARNAAIVTMSEPEPGKTDRRGSRAGEWIDGFVRNRQLFRGTDRMLRLTEGNAIEQPEEGWQ